MKNLTFEKIGMGERWNEMKEKVKPTERKRKYRERLRHKFFWDKEYSKGKKDNKKTYKNWGM